MARQRPPSALMASALALASSVRMSAMATARPSAAKPRAIAAPIPRAPPVTSATRPLSLVDMGGHITCERCF